MIKKKMQNIIQENFKNKRKLHKIHRFDDTLSEEVESLMQSNFSRDAQDSIESLSEGVSKNDYYKKIEILQRFIKKLGQDAKLAVFLTDYSGETNIKEFHPLTLKNFTYIFKKTLKKIQKTKYKKINWGKQELIILIWVIEKYSKMNNTIPAQFNQNDWKFIASLVPEKDEQQCMFKWLSLSKNKSNQKFPWTSTEDQLLKILVIDDDENQKQKKWLDISKKLYLKNEGFKVYRTAKQCRQRWTCFLNPDLKKSLWTISEDTILIQNYLKIGKKWAFIAKLITGRTENAVKNRFNLILEKKKKIQYSCGYLSDQEFMKLHLKNIGCTEMLENQMKNSQTKMDPTYKPKYQSKKSNNQSLSSTKCKTIVQMSEYTVSQSRIEQPLVYKTISSKQNKILKNQLLDPYPLQKISSKQQLIDLDFKDQKGTLTNFNINNNFPKSIEFIEFNEQHMFKLYSFTSIGNFLTINNSINFLA